MTPEEIKHWKHICQKNRDAGCETFRADVNVVEELCDSALRLSAIKAAGDEEVEKIFAELERLYPNAKTSFMSLKSIVKYERLKTTRAESEIADLRETVEVLRGAFTKEEIVLLVAQTTNRRTGTEETRARARRILKAMGVEVQESSGNPGTLND